MTTLMILAAVVVGVAGIAACFKAGEALGRGCCFTCLMLWHAGDGPVKLAGALLAAVVESNG
jgi:hypothetical protein